MADLQKTIEIVFEGTDNLSKTLGALTSSVDQMASGLEQATDPFANLTKGLVATEAGVIAAGAAMVAFAVNDALSFEDALSSLDKVLGEGEGQAADYTEQIFALSDKMGAQVSVIAELAAGWRSAGYAMSEVFSDQQLGLVEATLRAMTVGELEAGEAMEALVSIMKGFGLEASEVERVLDSINAITNDSGTSFEQMATALSKVSATAKTTGLTLEETAGYLTPMVEAFQSGEIAGTALNSILAKLIDPTKEAAAALISVGVAADESALKQMSVKDILEKLGELWPTLTEQQKQNTAEAVAGAEQLAKFSALMNDFEGALTQVDNALTSSGSSFEEWRRKTDTTIFAIEKLKASFDALVVLFGSNFLTATKEGATALDALTKALQTVVTSDKFKDFLASLSPIFDDVLGLIKSVAENLPAAFDGVDFSGLSQAFNELYQQLKETLGGLFDGIDLTTPEGLRDAIQLVVDSIASLTNVNTGIFAELESAFQKLGQAWQWIVDIDPETLKGIGEGLASLTELNAVAKAVQGFVGPFEGLVQLLGGALVLKSITNAGAIGTGLTAIGSGLATLGGGVAASALFTLNGLLAVVAGLAVPSQLAGGEIYDLGERLAQLSEKAGLPIQSLADVDKALANGSLSWEDYIKVFPEAVREQDAFGTSADGTAEALGNLKSPADEAATALEKTGASADSAEGDVNVLKGTLTDLATDQRLKEMEFAAKLDIANIEADSQKAVAAIEAIGETSKGTADLLGTLYGMLTDTNLSDSQLQDIVARIAELNDAYDRQLEASIALTQEMAEYYKARTEFLQKENALIKIEGDGLQPHLEAFMWEILSEVQTRVNEQGLEFLTGMSG